MKPLVDLARLPAEPVKPKDDTQIKNGKEEDVEPEPEIKNMWECWQCYKLVEMEDNCRCGRSLANYPGEDFD